MSLSQAQGFIGAGTVYIQAYLSGITLGPRYDIGNTTKLTIAPKSDIKEQVSRKRDTYGTIVSTVALQQPAELSMTLETVNMDNLRLAFMGESAAYSQAAATVTDEAVTAVLNSWVDLANEDLDTTVVVTNSAASTTYVEGTDYEVNRRLGWLRALSTGAITEGQSLKVDYVAKAFTGIQVRGNTKPQLRAKLWLDGKNLDDDSIIILEAYEVVLTPSGEFDFFSESFATIELQGRMKVPTDKTEPFRVLQR